MRRFLPAIIALLLPSVAFASFAEALNSPYRPPVRHMDGLDVLGAMIGTWFGLAGIILVLTFLFGPLIFWVLMVIDATKRQWSERNMWLIVLWLSLFFGLYFVSALLYYFLVKTKSPESGKRKV